MSAGSPGRAPAQGPELTEDRLLGGRVVLRQPAAGYRAAIDPVLLAAAVPARPGERVLDLGCGAGAAALCLLARVPELEVTGLELQDELVALARENAGLNGHGRRFRVLAGDVTAPAQPEGPPFDRVMANPPFHPPDGHRAPRSRSRAAATREEGAGLTDWLNAALAGLRPKGSLTLIQRADRLDEVLARLIGKAGDTRIVPLWPAAGKAAKRVLLVARKGVSTRPTLCAGLTLHEAGGGFTAAAEAVLRDGAAIAI